MKPSGRSIVFAGLAVAVVAVAVAMGVAMMRSGEGPAAPRPRLVVVIVIDQFRYDFLQRFDAYFSKGGFKRFQIEGANFSKAKYLHTSTETCPGHAVIATGTWGNLNGIVANRWYDAARDREIPCARSSRYRAADNLKQPTIGDILKRADGADGKVIAASGKRSAAIMLGGQDADAAYWPDLNGRFVTGTRDAGRMPDWVREFNDARRVDGYFGKTWQRFLPVEAYAMLGPDDEPAENPASGLGRSFPHPMTGGAAEKSKSFYSAFRQSPYENEILAEFAMAALQGEQLGQDDITDLLAISFSAIDRIGHRFGPDSHEILDGVVRLDRVLERLLDSLDEQVGLDQTLIVLTADHGMASLPEVVRSSAGVNGAGRISEAALSEAVNRGLGAMYGPPDSRTWVASHEFPNLYLNERAMREKGIELADAEYVAKWAVQEMPGVMTALTRTELAGLRRRPDLPEPVRAMLLAFRPDRSGHVVYQVLPYTVVAVVGTNHGSHWNYDRHVPLMWLGRGVKPGHYDAPVSPADIAPTLLHLSGIPDQQSFAGHVLYDMLQPDQP